MIKRNLHIYNAKKFYSLPLYLEDIKINKKKCNVEQAENFIKCVNYFIRTHS